MAKPQSSIDPYAAWDSGDVKTAFRLFRSQAQAGDEGAWLNLGYFYDVGLGTRRRRIKHRHRLS
jgi:TPR repeat protein